MAGGPLEDNASSAFLAAIDTETGEHLVRSPALPSSQRRSYAGLRRNNLRRT